MLSGGIPIGRVFGISLRLHWTWFFIFILVTWALVTSYFPTAYPEWTLSMKIAAGLITSFLFFASVLIHELMHSVVAIHEGIQVHSITLFILGGVSQMTSEPKKPGDEFRMAIAGPASSLVIGGVFAVIFLSVRGNFAPAAQFVAGISYWLGLINIMLGVFNLVPGFPLDGGRVLRSIIWWRSKNLTSATKIASNIGRAVGFLFIFGGIYLVFTGNWVNGVWFALIGWFLENAAVGSYRQLVIQDILKGHLASEIMSRDCMMIQPTMTIEKLVNEQILTSGRRCFPVASDGRVEGIMSLNNVRAIPRALWPTKLVRDAMTPLDKLKSVRPDEDLNEVLQVLAENDINQVPVVQDNNIVGMVARDNIINFISLTDELRK
ncbi:MAG: site-2 protease family protein [Dehalococcoidales bacterium]|nr:site-2 protease family protein [Dehalococcoidales bacterium]